MKKVRGMKLRVHAFVTLKLGVSGQLHATDNFTPKKWTRYPFDRKPGGSDSRNGRSEEQKNVPVSVIEPRFAGHLPTA